VCWQDKTLAAQAEMEKQLSVVGQDVEDTRGKVMQVRSSRHIRILSNAIVSFLAACCLLLLDALFTSSSYC
jgi:hypothetical protein